VTHQCLQLLNAFVESGLVHLTMFWVLYIPVKVINPFSGSVKSSECCF
jgi:hypothetical protein